MKQNGSSFLIIFILLIGPVILSAQNNISPYFNIGYVTNIEKCSECKSADTGASFRIGLLTEKRMGYYLGFVFFNEYHPDYADYDDKGRLFIGGIDFKFMEFKKSAWYIKAGIAYEAYISTYRNSNRTETEGSFKPDFGLFINLHKINLLLAWQPSDPHHYNFGIGYTFK